MVCEYGFCNYLVVGIHTRLDMRNLLAFCEYANLVFELENYVLCGILRFLLKGGPSHSF